MKKFFAILVLSLAFPAYIQAAGQHPIRDRLTHPFARPSCADGSCEVQQPVPPPVAVAPPPTVIVPQTMPARPAVRFPFLHQIRVRVSAVFGR